MGSFQASEGRWGAATTLKRRKVEHNSFKFVSLENSRHLQICETEEVPKNAIRNQQVFWSFFFFSKGPEKRKGKRVRGENTPKKMSSTC